VQYHPYPPNKEINTREVMQAIIVEGDAEATSPNKKLELDWRTK